MQKNRKFQYVSRMKEILEIFLTTLLDEYYSFECSLTKEGNYVFYTKAGSEYTRFYSISLSLSLLSIKIVYFL